MRRQDDRAVVERALRPGAVLWVPAGAGNDGEGVVAGGSSGNSWHVRRRAARKGSIAGIVRGRRVEFIPAGGGVAAAAERRPGVKHCAGGRGGSRAEHVPEEEEERGGVQGTCLEIPRILGTSR
jgi:hypothetical protein